MNPNLANSIRNALTNQITPTEHPSADQLTAFLERSLLPAERMSVTDHLARCSECREVIFLCSDVAAESPVSASEPARAFSGLREKIQGFFGGTGFPWGTLLAWGVPVTAALVLGALLLVRHQPSSSPQVASGTESIKTGQEPSQIAGANAPPSPNGAVIDRQQTLSNKDQQGDKMMSDVQVSRTNSGESPDTGNSFPVQLRNIKDAGKSLGGTPGGPVEGVLTVLPSGGLVFHCVKASESALSCITDITLQRNQIKSATKAGHNLVLSTATATYTFTGEDKTMAAIANDIRVAR